MQSKFVKTMMMTVALAVSCGSAFADMPLSEDIWVSKRDAGRLVSSECPGGTALNGVAFRHNMNENLTWQEDFAALCVAIPLQKEVVNSPKIKEETVTQSAPAGGYLTKIGFLHNPGKDYTFQEFVGTTGVSAPKPFHVDNGHCRDLPGDRRQSPLLLQCSSDELVTSISFSHPHGQNLTYQEAVTITCCPFSN